MLPLVVTYSATQLPTWLDSSNMDFTNTNLPLATSWITSKILQLVYVIVVASTWSPIVKFTKLYLIWWWIERLGCGLDLHPRLSFMFSRVFSFFFFFFWLQPHLLTKSAVNSTLVHCLRIPQITFFNNFFIKNGSHDTIHTFKNYFATVFSIFSFSKIISIQTDPNRYRNSRYTWKSVCVSSDSAGKSNAKHFFVSVINSKHLKTFLGNYIIQFCWTAFVITSLTSIYITNETNRGRLFYLR